MSDDKPNLPERGYSGLFTTPTGQEPVDMSRVVTLRLTKKHMDQFIDLSYRRSISRAELLREIVLEWLESQEGSSTD